MTKKGRVRNVQFKPEGSDPLANSPSRASEFYLQGKGGLRSKRRKKRGTKTHRHRADRSMTGKGAALKTRRNTTYPRWNQLFIEGESGPPRLEGKNPKGHVGQVPCMTKRE